MDPFKNNVNKNLTKSEALPKLDDDGNKQESNNKFYDFLGYVKKNFFKDKLEESPEQMNLDFY